MAYTPATPADLKARYPAFAAVDDAVIQPWLNEGVTEATRFPDDYRARGEMAYAAHMMASTPGVLATTGTTIAGVTAFRSGDFSAQISDSVAQRTGWSTTIYGQEFVRLRRRFLGGPRLVGCPSLPCDV